MKRRRGNRWLQVAVNLAVVAAGLVAVSFLPPDNSLADVKRTGVLKLCVPAEFPPLVQDDPQAPGFDIELMRKVAEDLGVRLTVNVMLSMGKDFNPRNWQLTRGQCNVIAGGVADTVQTRNFLQTIPTGAETGWVAISLTGKAPSPGSTWAVWPGSTGLDRVSLSSWVRERGIKPVLVRSEAEIPKLLQSGTVDGAIMERFVASSAGLPPDYRVTWLEPEKFSRYPMALGLWKGDQTLFRAVGRSVEKINRTEWFGGRSVEYGLSTIIQIPD
jgi:ABC-type amino acid transport substrate-binding protein